MNFTLEKWSLDDVPSLVKYANNFKIARFLRDGFPHPYEVTDAITFISRVIDDDPPKVFAIKLNHEVIGAIGVSPQTDIYRRNAEMGYWLAEPFWGKGIMTEAVSRMVEYGFSTFDIDRIFAKPFGSNKASHRVLEKAGFRLEATFSKALIKNNRYEDELVYGIRR